MEVDVYAIKELQEIRNILQRIRNVRCAARTEARDLLGDITAAMQAASNGDSAENQKRQRQQKPSLGEELLFWSRTLASALNTRELATKALSEVTLDDAELLSAHKKSLKSTFDLHQQHKSTGGENPHRIW